MIIYYRLLVLQCKQYFDVVGDKATVQKVFLYSWVVESYSIGCPCFM